MEEVRELKKTLKKQSMASTVM